MKFFTTNKRLALLAVLAGLILLIAGNVSRDPVVNGESASGNVSNTVPKIDPHTLADWLLQSMPDYRLIDLRDAEEYSKLNIPTSVNMTRDDLRQAYFSKAHKIVICASNGVESAEVVGELLGRGIHGALVLEGGITAWEQKVLNPILPEQPSREDVELYNRRQAVAKFFKGETDVASPVVVAPKTAITPPSSLGPKKKKEGC